MLQLLNLLDELGGAPAQLVVAQVQMLQVLQLLQLEQLHVNGAQVAIPDHQHRNLLVNRQLNKLSANVGIQADVLYLKFVQGVSLVLQLLHYFQDVLPLLPAQNLPYSRFLVFI